MVDIEGKYYWRRRIGAGEYGGVATSVHVKVDCGRVGRKEKAGCNMPRVMRASVGEEKTFFSIELFRHHLKTDLVSHTLY